jgi:hypothetical protein
VSGSILAPLRRWAVEWLSARRPEICEEILTPEYSILIGGFLLDGREAYVEGTLEQLDRFPGLGLTIHELITSGDRAAIRFSEHGASTRHGGSAAAWEGIALFGWDGERLDRCGAEEDYLSRRRQLADGVPDLIEAPAPAPWNTAPVAPDPAAEAAVRAWLEAPDFESVTCDDGRRGASDPIPLEDPEVELDDLFSAGSRVAFHGTRRGRYGGGLAGLEDRQGAAAELHFAGLVTVVDGAVVDGRVVRDRLGLSRALQKAPSR